MAQTLCIIIAATPVIARPEYTVIVMDLNCEAFVRCNLEPETTKRCLSLANQTSNKRAGEWGWQLGKLG
jgi:hypothetical protein